ncbi:hypothetical protein A3K48_02275 [candidate division WOR-1 bacterium RIFOXYA12_FULL_52_29]|uniref:Porin domain-containing protein n=1 Tax=candidate division WOR-1 bacterium RIFOXYC12_FULL_54_18 TaxID=1802584 RepID=A0A1F4T530_UNCSA|nr:MAG: hypothetical protein A3K44_02275 [candidate division WOR-1 bacterium RIFOXYA2_FULL_51_19]OGC17401.1 MAG: hypothetical protein A3K48_02275 [candidate division WOR-1 bacterium RIFOXYA12_FULL_52_29]OGC26260.1 MAG: hypothetical protein A3K32_02270 [candidate division WOR-1 bacterium RIFOXYB2_FULL_45_9]OGC27818.1 MAG: hypothetical protein A3K49_02275 [candidate division WOR-1 bacterium RIFOXYC12_FULL_54_18]OGC29893.1 MAG: hypothetical protein A2346_04060 [candidate division WOR-1 bacterium R
MKRVLLMLFCLLASTAGALDFTGYYETDLVGLIGSDGSAVLADLNRLRLRIDNKLSDSLALRLEPRYYLLLNSSNLPLVGATGLDQLTWDRAYLKYYSSLCNLTAGKQRIAWGSGYIWNPTDIFNPFVLSFAVKEEDESNVEAIRCEAPLGPAASLDLYATSGPSAKKGGRVKNTVGLFDLAVSYVDFGSGDQGGFDAVGELLGLGVRSELAFKRPVGATHYIQSVWGCDYTLESGIGLNLEYFFNGFGKKSSADYDWTALRNGTISQLAINYLFLSANKTLDELTGIRVSLLTNLDDRSFIFYPALTRSLREELDLNLEALFSRGGAGSEYEKAGTLLMARLTWSF